MPAFQRVPLIKSFYLEILMLKIEWQLLLLIYQMHSLRNRQI